MCAAGSVTELTPALQFVEMRGKKGADFTVESLVRLTVDGESECVSQHSLRNVRVIEDDRTGKSPLPYAAESIEQSLIGRNAESSATLKEVIAVGGLDAGGMFDTNLLGLHRGLMDQIDRGTNINDVLDTLIDQALSYKEAD
jgi:hypothetical protein